MKRYLLFLIISLFSLTIFGQQSLDKKLKKLDAYYEQSRIDYNVPGLAVAIIKDGEIIFSKGYGTRNVDTGDPVDGNTLFAVASNTKSFTAAALAMLIDEGKLSWDDKVRDYLPWFELYDPYVSESFNIRDLLTHRSGLMTFSGDLLWYGTNLSRREVVESAKYLEPTFSFRDGYGYSNIMYIAAGLVIEEVSGMAWEDFIRTRILEPLHMDRTLTSTLQLPQTDNYCAPHNDFKGDLITIEWMNWDNVAPAGALISSVNDLSKWLDFQMRKGVTPDGDTLINEKHFREMWQAHNSQTVSSFSEKTYPSTHFRAYGLGWGIMDYLGVKVIGHGGGYDGFITNTTFIPEENLGMVFLTNKNTGLYHPLRYKTLDILLGNELETDWSADVLKMVQDGEKEDEAQRARAEEARVKDSKPTLPLEEYLGTYNCEMYGNAKVYMEDEQMMVHLEPTDIFVGTLTHWQYNTWKVEMKKMPSLSYGLVNFLIDDRGEVTEMQIDIPNPDFYFTELKFLKVKE